MKWHLLLIEAECDLLEGDNPTALTKFDEIIARCTWQPIVNRAKQLKKFYDKGWVIAVLFILQQGKAIDKCL